MSGLNADTRASSAGLGAVTIVEGSTFCVSGPSGDIEANRPHGLFFRDTRLISEWNLLINGIPVEPLSAIVPQPFRAVFIGRAPHVAGRADTPLLVERERWVGTNLREDIRVRNYSRDAVDCSIELRMESDFADIFEVKGGSPHSLDHSSQCLGDTLVVESAGNEKRRGLVLHAANSTITDNRVRFDVTVPPHGRWLGTVTVTPTIEGEAISGSFPLDQLPHESEPARRFVAWHSIVTVHSLEDDAIEKVIAQSQRDLGSLRIFDPDHPERAVVAAGAPWFMALFGRDSILTSIMALPVDPSLALGTLQTLASLQGSVVDPLSEEQPGRILHEVRLGVKSSLALGGGDVYYGSIDATPLFVVALGELSSWGIEPEALSALLPHADRALDWIKNSGDQDGDGFVEYSRMHDQGLINQGWKDSWDGINFADGELAQAPIALCEVQGYVYAAYRARAQLAQDAGEHDAAKGWWLKAKNLKEEFNARFWLEDKRYFAVALDRDKRPVDSCASNMGHCLWSGIVDADKAPYVAERLLSKEMFTGWGVRTLASDMGAYNPVSYHNGSVWPHDNALIAAGLMRYGFVEESHRVVLGLFEAADHFGGRLPELFCGFDRDEFSEPVPYPTSCSPQAWAAATPFSLMRTLLRFEPHVPTKELWLAPELPAGFGDVRIEGLQLDGTRMAVYVLRDRVVVSGLPEGVTLHRERREKLIAGGR